VSQIYKNSSGGGGGTPIITIDGDTGSITGSTVTIYADNAANNSGSTVKFVNSGTVSTLDVSDTSFNTMIGNLAGNTSGAFTETTGLGYQAGTALTSGSLNTFIGLQAGKSATIGDDNTLIGATSGGSLTTGSNNTTLGQDTLNNLVTGGFNTIIGCQSGSNYSSSESDNIIIGNSGNSGESNVIRLGSQGTGTGLQNKCFVAGIVGNTVSNQEFVTINSATGQMGVTSGGGVAADPFMAYLSTTQSDVTGDGTVYQVNFDTVSFDVGGNFTTGGAAHFTAQATGYYHFDVAVNINPASGSGDTVEVILNYTGGQTYLEFGLSFLTPLISDTFTIQGSAVVSMAMGDIANVTLTVGTGTKTTSITGLSSPLTYFSGYRVS